MTLAGGALSLAGCGGVAPCVNAGPDPCICGRPESSREAKAECDADKACESMGGVWIISSTVYPGGMTVPSHCEIDGGTHQDAAPISDASAHAG